MKNTNIPLSITWFSVFIAIALAVISTQIPLIFQDTPSIAAHAFLATAIVESILQISSAILFLLGLKHFKIELKHAYFLICAGIVLLGLTRIQLPLFQAINFWNSPWVTYGGAEISSLIAHILILAGLASFAKLLKLKTKLVSPALITGIALASVAIIIAIPHSSEVVVGGTEFSFDSYSSVVTVEILFGILASALTLKIKQNINSTYANALAWLFLALIFSTISAAHILVFHIVGFNNFYVQSGLALLPTLASAGLFLKAGYAFNKIKLY